MLTTTGMIPTSVNILSSESDVLTTWLASIIYKLCNFNEINVRANRRGKQELTTQSKSNLYYLIITVYI
jgi:hypothetical protein